MRRCRGPLDQMKAIVGLALWCLCNAYLLFWWEYCDHRNVFSSQGSATAQLVLHSENHYCTVETDFLMSQFSEMSGLWNIMSFVPVSICCKMKKKDTCSLKIHQKCEFKSQHWGGDLLFIQCRTSLHNAAMIILSRWLDLKKQYLKMFWSYFIYQLFNISQLVMLHSNGK